MKASTTYIKLFTTLLSLIFPPTPAFALLIPAPLGPYSVIHSIHELIDPTRPHDPWNASHSRRLMVSRLDPIPLSKCRSTHRIPYMSPFLAAAEDAIYAFYLNQPGTNITWPSGVLTQLELEFCRRPLLLPPPQRPTTQLKEHEYPIVILGAGLNTTRLFYSATAQKIASKGYTVVTVDHPYDTDVVEFPSDGSVIYGGRVGKETELLEKGLDVRADDLAFVMDWVTAGRGHGKRIIARGKKVVKAAVIGHSYGGAAAATVMSRDERFVGGVNMDGMMFGEVLEEGIARDQSFLLWGSVGHNSTSDESWARFLDTVRGNGRSWIKEVSVRGSGHGSFWDVALIADVAGWRESQSDEFIKGVVGDITGERAMEIMGEYLDDFLRMSIKARSEGLLEGPSEDYPELEFL